MKAKYKSIMLVIGVAGMRAAGKTTVNEVAKEMGINSMEMRSIVVDMMKEKGIEITNRSLREFADDFRKKEGYDVVARKMIERINGMKEKALVVNGIRGYDELKRFREVFGDTFVLIGIFAPQNMRFARVMKRSLPEDPKSWDEFVWADEKEMSWGVADSFAFSDYMVINTGSKEQMKGEVDRLLKNLLRKG
ncbi:AAA family ATPase [Candidatus Micrarchaeota archaeon]|nr:AAA family ATPase [Candidatus Micrarchaeota archaeon]